MDQFEKLLQRETNTDERHAAAAEFFIGLKTAGAKKPKEVKIKHQRSTARPKSVKTEALEGAKKVQSKGKGGGDPVVRAKTVNVTSPEAVAGQAATPARSAAFTKWKPDKTKAPSKKITLIKGLRKKMTGGKTSYASANSSALTKEKRAFFTAAARAAKHLAGAAKGVGGQVKGMTEATKEILKPRPTRLQMIGSAIGGGVSSFAGKVSPEWAKAGWRGAGKKLRSAKTSFDDFVDPALAATRKVANKPIESFLGGQTAEAARAAAAARSPAHLVEWEKGYAKVQKEAARSLSTAQKARGVNEATGLGRTGGEIWGAIKDPSGKVSPQSIYRGLEGLGLVTPETLMGMGVGGYRAMKAAKAAREAAVKRNQMMWLGGGAAGLGALALLKGRKKAPEQE